jgi:uncharacterized protein YqkB
MDANNNHTKGREFKATEMGKLLDYKKYVNNGLDSNIPTIYKKISCHMIYNDKMMVDINPNLFQKHS